MLISCQGGWHKCSSQMFLGQGQSIPRNGSFPESHCVKLCPTLALRLLAKRQLLEAFRAIPEFDPDAKPNVS